MHRPLLAAASVALAASAAAEPITFDFNDPKGVNAVSFVLDSKLEPIVGMASGLTGTITYDPADPTSFKGELSLPADKVVVSNAEMTKVMHSAGWLAVGDNPLVTFTFNEVTRVETEDDETELEVAGELSVAGVTMPITVEVEVEYLKDMAAARGAAESGDLLVLRSDFSIDRTDFGIKPEMDGSVVAQTIEFDVAIVGYSK